MLLGALIFGLYAWFADTGLSTLSYYLILTGTSFIGSFLSSLVAGLDDAGDLPFVIIWAIIETICVVGGVSIIGVIGDLIIKLMH